MLLSCKLAPLWLHPSGSVLPLAGLEILAEVPLTLKSPEKLHPVFFQSAHILHQDYAADLNRNKINPLIHKGNPDVMESQTTQLP